MSDIIESMRGNTMPEFTLFIDGMHCGSCIRRVAQALSSVPDVRVEEVRLGAARLNSPGGAARVDDAIAALSTAGYAARLEHPIEQ
jgi:copper chaperone